MFAIFLTLLLGLAFGFKVFGFSIFKGKSSLGLPNGNKWYFPLIGETLAYGLKPHKSNSLGSFFQDRCSRYGKVFRSHLFGSPTIVSCDLEFNTFVLQNEEKLFQTSYPKHLRDILGHSSVLFASGNHHKKLRSVAVSFLSRPANILLHVEKLSLSFIDSWKAKKNVFFYEEAKQLSFYLMLKSLLSMEPEDPVAGKLFDDFLTLMKGFVSLPLHIPGTAYSKAIKARESILSTLKDIIQQRNMMSRARGDFLDEILADDVLNEKQKMSIMLDLIFAGFETPSGLIALVVCFLAQDPSSLQKLQEEHQLLRKRKKDGEPWNWEDYKNMEFTSHVINEALRCGNVAQLVFREAIKDVKFKEYTIPAGWKVLPILSGPHLDPSLHDHPMKFNPQRWKDNPTISRKVAPFGGGLRICPASELAKWVTTCFLHHFVLNLRWKIKEDESPMAYPYLDFKRGLELEIEQIQ